MKCLCAGTRRAARLVTQLYEEELRKANMTAPQFELLGTLSARPGLPQAELAETLGLNQTTLSRNLAVLLERHWISQAESAADKRKVHYTLTGAGRKAWQLARPHWQHAQHRLQQSLGSDWQDVLVSLEKLAAALDTAA